MLWTYERSGKKTAIEVRSALSGKGFELLRRDADGREIVETFASAQELNRRMLQIETDLLGDGWCLAGAVQRSLTNVSR